MMTEENYYYSLLKYLSFGVLYDIYCEYEGNTYILEAVNRYNEIQLVGKNFTVQFYDVKPYLRPMSSMTEEEAIEIDKLSVHDSRNVLSIKIKDEYLDVTIDDGFSSTETITLWYDELISSIECLYWLLEHHFDFMGLISKGLAIEAPKEMYAIKEQ